MQRASQLLEVPYSHFLQGGSLPENEIPLTCLRLFPLLHSSIVSPLSPGQPLYEARANIFASSVLPQTACMPARMESQGSLHATDSLVTWACVCMCMWGSVCVHACAYLQGSSALVSCHACKLVHSCGECPQCGTFFPAPTDSEQLGKDQHFAIPESYAGDKRY